MLTPSEAITYEVMITPREAVNHLSQSWTDYELKSYRCRQLHVHERLWNVIAQMSHPTSHGDDVITGAPQWSHAPPFPSWWYNYRGSPMKPYLPLPARGGGGGWGWRQWEWYNSIQWKRAFICMSSHNDPFFIKEAYWIGGWADLHMWFFHPA